MWGLNGTISCAFLHPTGTQVELAANRRAQTARASTLPSAKLFGKVSTYLRPWSFQRTTVSRETPSSRAASLRE